jgi:WD40 repeat protein
MRPGAEPLARLHDRLVATCGDERVARHVGGAGVLAEAPGRAGTLLRLHAAQTGRPILLVVDQLEELVTQDASARARRAFAQALLASADDPAGSIRVVVALRDDFLVRLSQVAGLGDTLAANMLLLGPPDADGLADALRRPAQRLGHDYEPGLIDEMVAAAAGEAAPLPLLQLAASRLWERRDGERRLLSRAALEAAGGVAGILAAHASEVLHRLSGAGEVALARRLLCDLVTEEGARRRTRTEELLARYGDAKMTRRVLECLISGRLVTSSRGERGEWIELAHESLISGWAQLRDWLDGDRGDRQFRERLHAAAALWAEHGRSDDLLWRGETLDEASRWRGRHPGMLGPMEQAFLARCSARHHRARNLRRGLFAVASLISIAATITAIVAVRASREAARQVRLRELMRAAVEAEDPLVGALILAELEGQAEPPGGLAAAVHLAAQPIPRAVYRAPGPIVAGALSPDGRWAAVCFGARGSPRAGDVELWRVDGSGRPVVLHGHEKACLDVSFSRDGSRIVTGSADERARIWRADGAGEAIVLRHGAIVEAARFTPDDAHVLTVAPHDHAARLWRADGQGQPVVFAHQAAMKTAALSPDGSQVVTAGEDGLRLWRVDGAPLAFRAGSAEGARFSPDGTRIVSGHASGELRVWRSDLSDAIVLPGARAPFAVERQSALVVPPNLWSPDGQRIAHGTERGAGVSRADGTGTVWEIERRGYGENLLVAFNRDGSHVLTVDDEEIRVWTPDADPAPMVLRGHGRGAPATVGYFSEDGARILTVSNDRSARVWALGDPRGARIFREPKPVTSLAASPDGRLLLTTSADGTARLWPVGGGAPTVLDETGETFAGAFDPSGTRVALARTDGLVVWRVTGGAPLSHPIANVAIGSVAYSPDGVWLAATELGETSGNDLVTLLRADGSAAPQKPWPQAGQIFGISFSPDSSRVAAAHAAFGRIWRSDGTGEPVVLPVIQGRTAPVFHPRGEMLMTSSYAFDRLQFWSLDGREHVALARAGGGPVAWSPDGERVAVGHRDGSVRITRVDGADDPIVIRAHQGVVTGVAFLPDGRLATSGDSTVRLWLLDWRELVASLRAATTACLTPDQRVASLRQSPESARAAWESCERRYGRAP